MTIDEAKRAALRGEKIPFSDELAAWALENNAFQSDPVDVWRHRGFIPGYCFVPGKDWKNETIGDTAARYVRGLLEKKWLRIKSFDGIDYPHVQQFKAGRNKLRKDQYYRITSNVKEIKELFDRVIRVPVARPERFEERLRELLADHRIKAERVMGSPYDHDKAYQRLRKGLRLYEEEIEPIRFTLSLLKGFV